MCEVFKQLNLTEINKQYIEGNKYDEFKFDKSKLTITCYDGPPSVSGLPGIHHILSRTLKDIFCRYKYLKGCNVINKSGWDTHGLPVELKVEKQLGVTKKDIGKTISIEEYNRECHESVNEYTDKWKELTLLHGYCTDIDHPYITCDQNYIESEWWAFKQLYDKGYVYQDYSIQPYSPAAGTGLSSHELNQPGCYRLVKDLTVTAMFKCLDEANTYFIAWTTTPWTLPANSALAVNKNIDYVKINCKNKYSGDVINVILAKEALQRYFDSEKEYNVIGQYKGADLVGRKYEQLFKYVQSTGKAFEIINADYVTTTDGTGIVHIAPSFGADDRRVSKESNICDIVVIRDGVEVPIVDEQGRYVEEITDLSGCYVKKAYYDDPDETVDVDVEIVKKLKQVGLCFRSEKHEHSYPHCWRTDKPLLYYPLKAWFIKTTSVKGRMIELNKKIDWHPESTGSGRFANWLENLVDWNVSRNRFWGTPIPIWMSEDGKDIKCIGSFDELENEIKLANEKLNNINEDINKKIVRDSHKPFIDKIILVGDNGKKMYRVPEVLDVWFDSGCMPFAQYHYPFENKDDFDKCFPAEFICEGVDQTRGWFFTLHVLSTMLFDNISYKHVVSNGLVLDKNGNKMSKRLGNSVDPFDLINKYGSDAVRWYMISNTDPWENLKFDVLGVEEVVRKFFITLFNTYNFYALYSNSNDIEVDNSWVSNDTNTSDVVSSAFKQNKLCYIDKWILSRLNTVIKDVDKFLDNYDPTRAIRLINDFVIDDLSNWYVRINRKRFSRNDNKEDQMIAFNILYECLYKTAVIMNPFAPFFSEWLRDNLLKNNRM